MRPIHNIHSGDFCSIFIYDDGVKIHVNGRILYQMTNHPESWMVEILGTDVLVNRRTCDIYEPVCFVGCSIRTSHNIIVKEFTNKIQFISN